MNTKTLILTLSLLSLAGCNGMALDEPVTTVNEGGTEYYTCDTPPMITLSEAIMCDQYAYCFEEFGGSEEEEQQFLYEPGHCSSVRENFEPNICDMYDAQLAIEEYANCRHVY